MIDDENIILYYGNKAGYIKENQAVVDVIFQHKTLIDFLTKENSFNVNWKEGVFDALINNSAVDAIGLKACRIYQLKPETDVRMKFISYDELIMQGFGKPNIENYTIVFDGEIETNDLEKIYEKFNASHPHGYNGHSLTMSDVIELYNDVGSSFHYVDSIGFKEIEFEQLQQELIQDSLETNALNSTERSTDLPSESHSKISMQPEQEEQEVYIFTL